MGTLVHVFTTSIFVIFCCLFTKTNSQVHQKHKYNAIVSTIHGQVEGFTVNAQSDRRPNLRINAFLGIPYAKRPEQFGAEWRTKFRFKTDLLKVPDLNQIEHVWDSLDRRVRRRSNPPVNISELRQALIQEWSNIPQAEINTLVNLCAGDFLQWSIQERPEHPYWQGIWNATYYRPACPQELWYVRETLPGFNRVDEDCLYLNIFAPNYTDSTDVANPPLYPVMVFIHGGGFTKGTAEQYPAYLLAERQIVVVTVNYRLGALGFFTTGDHYSPGNYGLWDQVRALEFVRDNIQRFRGNPRLVTLAGQGTGASCVGLHLLSAYSEKLFHQAIMQSGSDRSEWSIVEPNWVAQDYAMDLATQTGCPTDDKQRMVECLQLYRSADEIVNASVRVRLAPGKVGNPWSPVPDGQLIGVRAAFLPDPPELMRQQGRFHKYPVMAGIVSDEGSYFIPNLATLSDGVTKIQYQNILREFLEDRRVEDYLNTRDALEFQYTYWPNPRNVSMTRNKLTDLMSDYMFGTGLDEVVKHQSIYNRTYFYVFNYKSYNDYLPKWRGIGHGQDLQYVFGYPYFNETYIKLTGVQPRQDYSYGDRNVSDMMMLMWTNFVKSSYPTKFLEDPNTDFTNLTWPQYNLVNHTGLFIDNITLTRNINNFRQLEYGFWRDYFPIISQRSDEYTTPSPLTGGATPYEMATYSLVAFCLILIIVTLSLCIVMCRKDRKDNY